MYGVGESPRGDQLWLLCSQHRALRVARSTLVVVEHNAQVVDAIADYVTDLGRQDQWPADVSAALS